MTVAAGRGRLGPALALAVSLLMLLSALFVLQPQAPQQAATSSSLPSGFTFPYSYQQPSVPSDIGVQGISGTTVPLSQIGPEGVVGATGSVGYGPHPYSLPSATSTVSVSLLQGTISSNSPESSGVVTFTSLLTGNVITLSTNSAGTGSTSLASGWYLVHANPTSSSYTAFTQQMFIPSSTSLSIYLLPLSSSTVSVGNGGSGTIWFSETTNQGTVPLPQLHVSLLNSSQANAVIASGNTMGNGSVEFTGVSTAYSYSFSIDGYSNPDTGMRLYMANYTTQAYTFHGSVIAAADHSMAGSSYTTGTLTGTPLPSGSSTWNISQDTSITGGTTYISSQIVFKGSYSLSFSNADVYFNESWSAAGTPSSVSFTNSNVYFLSGNRYILQQPGYHPDISAQGSTIFANMVRPSDSIVLGFTNVSSTLFYYVDTNYPGAIYGTFYNDVVLNSTAFGLSPGNASLSLGNNNFYFDPHTDMNRVSFINSIPTGGDLHIGNINFTAVNMVNSTTDFSTFRFSGSNFNLNLSLRPSGNSLNAVWLNLTHSNIDAVVPQNMTYIQYINTLPSNGYGNPPGAGPIAGFSMQDGASGINYMTSYNISYTHLKWGFPMPNVDITFGSFAGRLNFYNDWFDYNLTSSQLAQDIASYHNNAGGKQPNPSQTVPFEANRIVLDFHGPVSVNYSYMNFAVNSFMRPYSNANPGGPNRGYTSYFDHDIFPYKTITQDDYSFFRFFVASPAGSFEIANTTFGYIHFNWTQMLPGNNFEGFAAIWTESATNQAFSPPGYINITHDTFQAPSFDSGPNGMAGQVQFAKYDIVGIVSYCKFMNSPDYVVWDNKSLSNSYLNWYLPPHQDNILATAADVTIHDNYFLNLTNLTAPIGTDQAYQNGGYGGNVTEYGNHFFYYPLPGMSYINETWGFSNAGYYGTPVPIMNGAYNGSHIAYEIPMGLAATMTVKNGGAYIYNSTIAQLPGASFVVNDRGWSPGQPSQYSWIMEPNFVWNGSSYVAQYQGMGGPQPNLTYNGYHYQWAFEQNMTYISTDTASASPIPMAWSIPNPSHSVGSTRLYLHNYTSGANQLLASIPMGYSSTFMSYTYRPWVSGLSAIFFINSTVTYTPPPPPPPTQTNYTVTFNELGLPGGTSWGVTFNSTHLVSTAASINFTSKNGTFPFSVDNVGGWTPSVTAGNVTVQGGNETVNITFAKNTYKVTFHETGLSGQTWGVTLNRTEQQTSSTSITFNEPNGTYAFSIYPPLNSTANVTGGSFSVEGHSVEIYVSFNSSYSSPPGNGTNPPNNTTGSPNPSPNPTLFTLLGYQFHEFDLIVIAVGAISVSAVAFVVWRMESRRR